jgi:hypothetical protein
MAAVVVETCENIMSGIHHKYWGAFVGYLYIMDLINAWKMEHINTLRTGDADLRLYITTVQDGWRKSVFLTRAWCPRTIHLITQYMEPLSKWSCWRMFIETWPHSE